MSHTERIDGIVADLRRLHQDYDASLKAADDAAATRVPAEGGWTAAQVGYHVGIANARMAEMTGRGGASAPPDFVEESDVLTKVPAKVEASEAVRPPSDINKGAAIEQLDAGFKAIIEAFRQLPEDRGSQIVRFPFGALSMYQFGEFVVQHARRHLEQIRRALS